jgi:5'-deoxynucleotidase YfbR-like HD superfamily hydrolase
VPNRATARASGSQQRTLRVVRESDQPDPRLDPEAVAKDVDYLLFSTQAAQIRRFYRQPYWEAEGEASDRAMKAEAGVRLESVAEHSWKVADAALLLLDKYHELDRLRCLELAIIHDKLELITGDWSPIDSDASGTSTHAFNERVAERKIAAEVSALDAILDGLDSSSRPIHEDLYRDIIFRASAEARFIAAVDKLCSLTYVIQKKKRMRPEHLAFTVKYAEKSIQLYPAIKPYCDRLTELLCGGQPGLIQSST